MARYSSPSPLCHDNCGNITDRRHQNFAPTCATRVLVHCIQYHYINILWYNFTLYTTGLTTCGLRCFVIFKKNSQFLKNFSFVFLLTIYPFFIVNISFWYSAYVANLICNPVYIIYHTALILITLLGCTVVLFVNCLLEHCVSLMLYL